MNSAYAIKTNTLADTVTRILENRTISMGNGLSLPVVALNRRTHATYVLDFDALYRAQFSNLYSYVAALMRDRQSAEDVTAEAFEKAYRKRNSFNARKGTPEAWLFRIARNAALDHLRKAKNNPITPLVEESISSKDPRSDPEFALEGQARKEVVSELLGRVSARERELLALKFFAEFSNQEMAKILGVSESNVGTLLYRALEKIRRETL